MRYRRISIGGAVYFFTLNLADRSSHLLVEQAGDLREAVKAVRAVHPFEILAWVSMPDHLHTLWCLPENDADYPMRWGLIKAGFPGGYRKESQLARAEERRASEEFGSVVIRNTSSEMRPTCNATSIISIAIRSSMVMCNEGMNGRFRRSTSSENSDGWAWIGAASRMIAVNLANE